MTHKSRQNFERFGIQTEHDLKTVIERIFETNTDQHGVMDSIYRLVVPDWDYAKKVNGYPEVGGDLWMFIYNRFLDFDRMFHPDALPGGAWMSWGFLVNKDLTPWDVSLSNCSLVCHGGGCLNLG